MMNSTDRRNNIKRALLLAAACLILGSGVRANGEEELSAAVGTEDRGVLPEETDAVAATAGDRDLMRDRVRRSETRYVC